MSSKEVLHNSLPLQPKQVNEKVDVNEKTETKTSLWRKIINFITLKWVPILFSKLGNYLEGVNRRRKERVAIIQHGVNNSFIMLINIFRIIGYLITLFFILAIVISIISGIIFVMSGVSYAILYSVYVPRVFTLQQPIYFEMEPTFNANSNGKPSTNFTLPPQLLQDATSYSIHLHLLLPTSQTNQNLGNFMCRAIMRGEENEIISQSSRPAILPYKSPLHRILYTFFFAIPLVLGFIEESELVEVTLYPLFTENFAIAPTHTIELILSAPMIEIQSATLYITTELLGLHYFMYYYFTIATSMAISLIFYFYWVSFIFSITFLYIIMKYFDLPLPYIKPLPSLFDNVNTANPVNNINNINDINNNNVSEDNIEIIRIDKKEKEGSKNPPRAIEKIVLTSNDIEKAKNIDEVINRLEKDVPSAKVDQIEINDNGKVEGVIFLEDKKTNDNNNNSDADEREFIELTKPYEPVASE